MQHPSYRHTQWLWLLWIVLPAATAAVVAAALAAAGGVGWAVVALVVAADLAVLLLLGCLTIELDDREIAWRFGLLGWPRWSLPLQDIAGAELAPSSPLEGWGIRRTRDGMLYNAAGMRTVRLVTTDGRRLRLGTDEPERLLGFLQARLRR